MNMEGCPYLLDVLFLISLCMCSIVRLLDHVAIVFLDFYRIPVLLSSEWNIKAIDEDAGKREGLTLKNFMDHFADAGVWLFFLTSLDH